MQIERTNYLYYISLSFTLFLFREEFFGKINQINDVKKSFGKRGKILII